MTQREIKFRAWLKGPQRMYENVLTDGKTVISEWHVFGEEDPFIEPIIYNIGSDDKHTVLMQYTGFKDKDGVEIYEGDVGRIANGDPFAPKTIVHVFFDDKQGAFACVPIYGETDIFGNSYTGKPLTFNGYNPHNFQIIGNIYQHTHLF